MKHLKGIGLALVLVGTAGCRGFIGPATALHALGQTPVRAAPTNTEWERLEGVARQALDQSEYAPTAHTAVAQTRLQDDAVAQQPFAVKAGHCYSVAVAWPAGTDGVSLSVGPNDRAVARVGMSVTLDTHGVADGVFCADGTGTVTISAVPLNWVDLGAGRTLAGRGGRTDVAIAIAHFPESRAACEARHDAEQQQLVANRQDGRARERSQELNNCRELCSTAAGSPSGLDHYMRCRELRAKCERRVRNEMDNREPLAEPEPESPPSCDHTSDAEIGLAER